MLAILQIISLIIGIISGIISLAILLIQIIKKRRAKGAGGRRYGAVIILIIFVLLCIASFATYVAIPEPRTEVKITQPAHGSNVDHTETVKGISKEVPEGYAIWVMVSPDVDPNLYPNKTPAKVQDNGDWVSGPIYIGLPGDTGNGFQIYAVLANADARKFLVDFMARAEKENIWGLRDMPEGAQIMDSVDVTRK